MTIAGFVRSRVRRECHARFCNGGEGSDSLAYRNPTARMLVLMSWSCSLLRSSPARRVSLAFGKRDDR